MLSKYTASYALSLDHLDILFTSQQRYPLPNATQSGTDIDGICIPVETPRPKWIDLVFWRMLISAGLMENYDF